MLAMNDLSTKTESPLHSVTPLHLEGPPSMALLLAKAFLKLGNTKLEIAYLL